jgi:hypothetical protein
LPVPLIGLHEDFQACVQSPCAHHVNPLAEQIDNLRVRVVSDCYRLLTAGARWRLFARVRCSGTIINALTLARPSLSVESEASREPASRANS